MKIRDQKEAVKMAFDQLRANKLRSGLTILGIVIGVVTVIAISSVINGLNSQVSGMVEAIGTTVIWVFRFPVIVEYAAGDTVKAEIFLPHDKLKSVCRSSPRQGAQLSRLPRVCAVSVFSVCASPTLLPLYI